MREKGRGGGTTTPDRFPRVKLAPYTATSLIDQIVPAHLTVGWARALYGSPPIPRGGLNEPPPRQVVRCLPIGVDPFSLLDSANMGLRTFPMRPIAPTRRGRAAPLVRHHCPPLLRRVNSSGRVVKDESRRRLAGAIARSAKGYFPTRSRENRAREVSRRPGKEPPHPQVP